MMTDADASDAQGPYPSPARHEVIVVRHGFWRTTRSYAFLNYAEHGESDGPQAIDYYFWVIRGGEKTIVVDTGFRPSAAVERGRTVAISPVEALAALGIGRDADVELILTHAHYDHIGNVDYFTRARVTMARAEYEFWTGDRSQHPQFEALVYPQEIEHLRLLHRTGRLRLLDGSTVLAPGIEAILAPGHTPGELMLIIDTPAGHILLTSDAVHFDEELARDMPFRHMTDLVDAYGTFHAIRRRVDDGDIAQVIAGHQAAVIDRFPRLDGPLRSYAAVIGRTDPHQTSIQK